MPKGKKYFLLSFDCELGWGYFDSSPEKIFSNKGKQERKYINIILDILDEFDIKSTWAIVGHLFHDKCEACECCPVAEMSKKYPWLKAKKYEELYYGKDIVDNILSRKVKHEIACHGYAHRLFDKMKREEAIKEIREWQRKTNERGIKGATIIFPRNKIGFLDIFKESGFICYRGEESISKIHSLKYIGKIIKTLDYISGISTPPVYKLENTPTLINLPASQLFFGTNRRVEKLLDALNLENLRIRRMIKGIKTSKNSTESEFLHIWAHPCQFKDMKDITKLRYLLYNVHKEAEKKNIEVITMSDLAKKAK